MFPSIIIIPIIVSVFVIVCGIALFLLLKKCVRWRVVSLVAPKRSLSDEEIIHNGVYSDSYTDGNYHTLGNLPTIENTRKQISSRISLVEGKEYPNNRIPYLLYILKEKTHLRRSFKEKFAYVTSRPQEIIWNKKNMGVYNIPENELKYYKENGLTPEINGETNLNFEHIDLEYDLELDRSDVGDNLTPNSNTRIKDVLNKTLGDDVLNEPLGSNPKRGEVLIETFNPKAIERLEKCLQSKIVEVCITEKKLKVTEVASAVASSEVIIENDVNEITEQEYIV
ncbi:hypothetical protein Anas_12569 [Armadillidium nasatum]|uniref:Uncharacterized protein n=1 Tax=Armadillidium nasatum TaxID=96803 RepID=A0A5N5TB00_9CRUS|nr:hypothetical protein Anas_12569 [Armadillidium nasatum]